MVEKNVIIKNKLFIWYFAILTCLFTFLIATVNVKLKDSNVVTEVEQNNRVLLNYNASDSEDVTYLSDISYIDKQSYTKWDKIRYDEASNEQKISIKIENNTFTFDKGIWAHATSQVTYDISNYDYKYFTAFVGINTTSSKGDGVKYTISTSENGTDWENKIEELLKKPGENADFIKVDISGANYLRLYAHHNGGNGNDHSVYADAKMVNEIVEDSNFMSVSEYDEILKNSYNNQTDITGELEFNLLKREFVNRVGKYTLNSLYKESGDKKEAIDWLMNNQDVLRSYILGGKPDGGSYYNSLTELSRLYASYKNDFKDTTPTNNPWYPNLTKGDVYQKMAISLSLTHSTAVGYWAQINHPSNRSDSVERYAIFKDMYDRDKFVVSSRQDHTPWYEALQVEEMRYVMNSIIDDEELLWLNEYTQKRIDAHPNKEEVYLQPHTYIAYVWPDFGNPIFHDPDKKDYWDEVFEGIFSKYGVTYSTEDDKVKKAWMSMRNEFGTGAVCGGISKLGTHIRAAHGTPASVISQPGHAAIIYYRKNTDGKGYWTIDNDISGWAQSGKTERLGIRMPLGWGNDSYVSGWAASYIVLAQEAMNDWDSYEKAEKLLMLADVYKDDAAKREEIIRKALDAQSIHIDAWWELIKLYNNDDSKTEEDYYNLATSMSEALLPFPLPLYNLMALLKGNFTSIEYSFKYALLQKRVLTDEKNFSDNTRVLQPSVTKAVGAYLLGQTDTSLATFSFDGDDAGKIVLSNRFDGNGIRWDYSLDGKNTWKEVSFTADEEHKLQLTPEEIASITAENDIYVHIVGVNYDEDNLYKIDITEGTLPVHNGGDYLFGNDLENRVVGTDETMEWRYSGDDAWTSYREASPDLTGNKSVEVRVGATGTKLPSPLATFNFTEDNQPETRKYVPVSYLSVNSVSSQATGNAGSASYSIDGNYNTRWHSAWNGSDKDKYIVIKFDKQFAISAMDYVPAGGGNGKILKAQILGSTDGENFTEITTVEWANNDEIKTIDFEKPTIIQYIKIVGVGTSSASSLSFIASKGFNFYQDLTQIPSPTAGIEYSITEKTNQDVVARLVNTSTNVKITNNDGSDTYTFTENGEFTFEFVDEATGLTGTSTARVDWIDKNVPSADIDYSTTDPTTGDVTATLKPNEEVTIIGTENGATEGNTGDPNKKNDEVTFDKNGVYTFYYEDEAGNVGSTSATVTWIDEDEEEATDEEIDYVSGSSNKTDTKAEYLSGTEKKNSSKESSLSPVKINKKNGKKNMTWIVIGVILVVLASIYGIVKFIIREKND